MLIEMETLDSVRERQGLLFAPDLPRLRYNWFSGDHDTTHRERALDVVEG